MKRDEIKKILFAIGAIYQNFQFNEVLLDLWPQILGDATYQETHAAAVEFMRRGSAFAPTPGQLLELIEEKRVSERRKKLEQQKQSESTKQIEWRGDLRSTLSEDGLRKLSALSGDKGMK